MRNVTVTLDDETARWARIEAARNDQSVSGFLRTILRQRMDRQASYEDARERYMARSGRRLGGQHPRRDELHDRADLR